MIKIKKHPDGNCKSMKEIKLSHIDLSFIGQELLVDFSYAFKLGNDYKIYGINGSGKTTFLRLLDGRIQSQGGLVESRSLKLCSTSETIPDFFRNFTVEEFLLYCSKYHCFDEGALSYLCTLTAYQKIAKKRCCDLSKGQKNFLNQSLVLIKNGDFFLLDEPFHSLDKEYGESLEKIIESKKKRNLCSIVTTEVAA